MDNNSEALQRLGSAITIIGIMCGGDRRNTKSGKRVKINECNWCLKWVGELYDDGFCFKCHYRIQKRFLVKHYLRKSQKQMDEDIALSDHVVNMILRRTEWSRN